MAGNPFDDIDADADDFQAALDRATEQHNLMLFTPVGTHREGALALLRAYAMTVDADDAERGASLLAEIQPEPDGDRPAISHVIGVSLATLDEWSRDPALRSVLRSTRVPTAPRSMRDAAKDVLGLAGKGRAFASLGPLTMRHGGLALFQGGCLAVAASVIARAKREGVAVPQLAGRILPGEAAARGSGAAFRKPKPAGPRSPAGDDRVGRDFAAWLRSHPDIVGTTAEDTAAVFRRLEQVAGALDFDLRDPFDVVDFADAFLEDVEPTDVAAISAALDMIHNYVHFRIDPAGDPAPWLQAHDEIEHGGELDEPAHVLDLVEADVPAALDEAVAAAGRVSADDRMVALGRMRLVTAVDGLLEWMGTGRPITQTGGLRRADIEPVAAMLRIAAIGVAKRPTLAERAGAGPIHATSMWDVPMLSAWWAALRDAGVIELTATRVRPGPHAAGWRDAEGQDAAASLELHQNLVALAFAHRLADVGWEGFDDDVAAETIRRILPAIAPRTAAEVGAADLPRSMLDAFVVPQTLRLLGDMHGVGMLELDELGGVAVEPAARDAYARGIVMFARLADRTEGDQLG